MTVQRPVAGGPEERAAAGDDDRAGAAPDRRVARGAPRRVDESAMSGAEGVPDVQQPAVLRPHHDDVSLVRRSVADVAAGRGDHLTAVEVERGSDLLELRQLRDRSAPDGM